MMKKSKKLSAMVMTLFLSIFLLVPGSLAKAETNSTSLIFTALGDSIGYGYTAAPGQGYVDLLNNYLKVQSRYSGLQLNNLSAPGITTTGLLAALQTTPAAQASIASSSIITLSIGGNNLLQPVVGAVATTFGVNPLNNPNLIAELTQAITTATEPDKTIKFNAILTQLATPTSPLSLELLAGVQQFTTDFPNIITQIKTLAPNAKIYIPTLYNPFNAADPCYAVFDQLIQGINLQIKALAVINNYEVADVYTAFAGHTDITNPVVNFNFLLGAVDPHPTTEGHKVIFDSHVKPVTSVNLSETSNTLKVGQTIQLTATVAPANAITNPDVVWTSSDINTASVDTTGKVTAVAAGNATITATTVDGNKAAVFTLDAYVPVSEITLSTNSANLTVGGTLQLTANVTPDNAFSKKILWKSSDDKIATVDSGKITAIAKGIVTITATSVDGSVVAQATITVSEAEQAPVVDTTTTSINSSSNSASATLPQTGSTLDYNVLLSIGLLILTFGAVLMIRKERKA